MAATKILIVEDEYIIASDIQILLEDMGYHICALVASGEQAVIEAE